MYVCVYQKMAHRDYDAQSKIYIGGLRDDANKHDLEDAFSRYGPVRNTRVASPSWRWRTPGTRMTQSKAWMGPGFAGAGSRSR